MGLGWFRGGYRRGCIDSSRQSPRTYKIRPGTTVMCAASAAGAIDMREAMAMVPGESPQTNETKYAESQAEKKNV
jgi:hypothetical protein